MAPCRPKWPTIQQGVPGTCALLASHLGLGIRERGEPLTIQVTFEQAPPILGVMDAEEFIRDGYTTIRGAVDAGTIGACQELIWAGLGRRGVRRDDPATWPSYLHMDDLGAGPFAAAGMSPRLTAAYDALIGAGRWSAPVDVGNAVVARFPSPDRANAGYHVESSYRGPHGQQGWVNIRSRARGLLALFLLTDVGPADAPTRLVCGSHLAVPEFLAPYGVEGTDSDVQLWYPSTLCRPVVHATGSAGDVFLCHPFIVHTATWPHLGGAPRMIAQPAVHVADGFAVDGTDPSPVARAIAAGITAATAK